MSRGCGDGFYYYATTRRCEPCYHLCDQHEQQGYTEQCQQLCPKYFSRMEAESSMTTRRPSPSLHTPAVHVPDSNNGLSDTFIVVVAILVMLVMTLVAAVVWKRRAIRRCCSIPEEAQTSATSSNQSTIDGNFDSKEALAPGDACSCQVSKFPIQVEHSTLNTSATTMTSTSYPCTFRQFAGVAYTVLDQPLSSSGSFSTVPKETI